MSVVVQHRHNLKHLPVLSEHITETDPSDSTECNFFTMALRFDMRMTPRARVTVVTIGNPSGIAATARETRFENIEQESTQNCLNTPPIVNMSSHGRCCHIPIRQITPITPKDKNESFLASSSMLS